MADVLIISCVLVSQGKRRVRAWEHAAHCAKKSKQHASESAFDTAVQIDPVLGILPETRCGLCSYDRLTTLSIVS